MSADPHVDAQSISELKARAEAERAGRPYLLLRDREGRQQTLSLPPDQSHVSVGRERTCDLRLDWDDQVSRLHARLEPGGDAWELVDDGSRNGSFVNDEQIRGRRRLNDGDVLRFGKTAVTFRSPKPQVAGPGPAAPGRAGAAVPLSTTQRRVLVALCRPYKDRGGFASPATDEQIAEELFISIGAVKSHLMVLSAKLGVQELPHNETRVRLVERAFSVGLVSESDL